MDTLANDDRGRFAGRAGRPVIGDCLLVLILFSLSSPSLAATAAPLSKEDGVARFDTPKAA